MWATMGDEAMAALHDLRWMIALIFVLIVADFWFGVSDSIHRHGQDFHFSRAARRTCNKLVDYITYLLLGAILGLAIFEPLGIAGHTTTAAIGIGLGCLWELDSISDHVCSLHNTQKRFSAKRLLVNLIKKKYPAIGEGLEEQLNDEPKEKNNKTK